MMPMTVSWAANVTQRTVEVSVWKTLVRVGREMVTMLESMVPMSVHTEMVASTHHL
jgi:hypothetical protein